MTRRRDRLTRAQAHAEIISVIPYAAKVSRGRSEDAFSESLVGLCEAAKTFEPSRGVLFFTHAAWQVRSRLSHLRRRRLQSGMTCVPTGVYYPCRPLSEAIADDEQAALAVPVTHDPEPPFIAAEAAEWIWEQVRKAAVCRKDYLIARAYFAHGMSMPMIAAGLGCSRARVAQRINRTLDRLRANARQFEGFL